MAKHTSKEAYYERLNTLANSNKPSIKESNTRNLGSLIDYKRAADGIAYGIVKENHNYYLKKAGTKQDPNVADFVYIGGMENITGYQFKSLAEADKQRNMMFHTIGGAGSLKTNKTNSKMFLSEDLAGKEIDMAADKVGDLDAATSAEKTPAMPTQPEGGDEMAAGLDAKPMGDEPATPDAGMGDTPDAEGGMGSADMPDAGGDGMGADADMPDADADGGMGDTPDASMGDADAEGGDMGGAGIDTGSETDEPNREIEKVIGKLTNKIRKTEMTDAQVKSYINSFITSFKDKLTDIEIEDRKEMANKLIKVIGQEEIDDLEASMPDEKNVDVSVDASVENPEEVKEQQQCSECGGFAQYAESRGYTAESIMECGEEEMGSLVSGYANAHGEGENDGDHKSVALFIKLMPQVLDILRNEYGHEEYADELEPEVNSMDESTEEDLHAQINELFGGLKSLGNAAKTAIGNKVQQGAQAVGDKFNQAKSAVNQMATNVKQTYNSGEINNEVKKLEGIAANLGQQVAALNKRMVGAGQQPVNVNSLLTTIKNQVGAGGAANLNKFKNENTDPANTVVQPNMIKEEEEEEIDNVDIDNLEVGDESGEESTEEISTEEKPFEKSNDKPISFSPGAQSIGVATVKPDGAATTGVDITISPDKNVQISMNESERKLRKYIRNRLEENAGLRKPILTESKKSPTLKKLDSVIDKQFKLYENVVVRNKKK